MFFCKSTAETKDTIVYEGTEYPLIKMEISSTSHPFYTGKVKLVDTAGRVDKFMNKYKKFISNLADFFIINQSFKNFEGLFCLQFLRRKFFVKLKHLNEAKK